jgi:murein DD-endopeptidase MepM/ murein hydrolase activator NlpD
LTIVNNPSDSVRLLTSFILLLAILLVSCDTQQPRSHDPDPDSGTVPVRIGEFGFPVDSLVENRSRVKRNETLSTILLKHNIGYPVISEIVSKSKAVYDMRKINLGKEYILFTKNDSAAAPSYFVYKLDDLNFVVIDLRDSITVKAGSKKLELYEKEFTGVIEYSLYETLSNSKVDINLALKLSEVFAWQIDFFSLQKGDYFRVIYEEEFVDGKFFRVGKIIAALFNHKDENYYAFYFSKPEQEDYFDERDQSLRKEFLKAPLKFSRISSRFSYKRFHPILKRYRPHLGIDYAAPTGTPVQAVGDGVVTQKTYQKGGAGRYIKIRHNSTYQSGYMHLSRYAKGLKVGSRVMQGQIIGYVGSTGLSTGPHLDFRFWKNGSPVNYLRQKFPPTSPVKQQYIDEYRNLKSYYLRRLENIETAPQLAAE